MYWGHAILAFTTIADSSTNSNSLSSTVTTAAFTVGGAIVGAACSYVVALLLDRRNPHKQLSWDASTDRSMLSVSSDIRDNVSIAYKGKNVSDLVAVKCRITNTGNTVIKQERVRFAFPDGSKILEADFFPQPERELKASRIDLPDLKETERMFSVGQLEIGQEVSFEIMATGGSADEWKIYPSGEGDVEFVQRDVGRIKDDQVHVRPVVIIAALYLIIAAFIRGFEAADFFGQFAAEVGVLIDFALFIALLPHIIPMARISQRLIERWLSHPSPATSVTVNGDDAQLVTSGTVGTVRFDRPAGGLYTCNSGSRIQVSTYCQKGSKSLQLPPVRNA